MNRQVNVITAMLRKDAVAASYGVVSSTLRRAASRFLGSRGVGDTGVNLVSVAAGTGLAQSENTHAQSLGSALRVGGIASLGNSVVESFLGTRKQPEDSGK